jgi:hypothetical protein
MITPGASTLDQLLQDQLAMLRAASALGIPVDYVELGSEFYFLGNGAKSNTNRDFVNRFATAQDYAAEADRWAAAIHAEFPAAHVSIVGTLQQAAGNAPRRLSWNASIAGVFMPHVDAITMHDYYPAQLDASRSLPLLLATPFVNSAEYHADARGYHSLDATGKPIWVTEYNVGTNDDTVKTEWAHGLMTATKSLLYLADPVFERVTMFDLASPQFGSLNRAAPYTTYAQGEAMQVYAPALRGATSVEALSFPASGDVTVTIDAQAHVAAGQFSYPSLLGFAFGGDGAPRSLVVVNESAQPYQFGLGRVLGDVAYSYAQKAADPATVVDGDHPPALAAGTGRAGDPLTLPPYSITRVDVG